MDKSYGNQKTNQLKTQGRKINDTSFSHQTVNKVQGVSTGSSTTKANIIETKGINTSTNTQCSNNNAAKISQPLVNEKGEYISPEDNNGIVSNRNELYGDATAITTAQPSTSTNVTPPVADNFVSRTAFGGSHYGRTIKETLPTPVNAGGIARSIARVATTTVSSGTAAIQNGQGNTTTQIIQNAEAAVHVTSKAVGVSNVVYHKIKTSAYQPMKITTETNAFNRMDLKSKIKGEDGKYVSLKKNYYSKMMKNYKSSPDTEYLFMTKTIHFPKSNQYAIFNRKTGRMEIMTKGTTLTQKLKNGVTRISVRTGMDATVPEKFFENHDDFIKNKHFTMKQNGEKIGKKALKTGVTTAKETAKLGTNMVKAASGDMDMAEFAATTLKAESRLATAPVRRKINRMVSTRLKTATQKAAHKVGARFAKTKLGSGLIKIKDSIKKTVTKVVGGVIKAVVSTISSLLAPLFPILIAAAIALGVGLLILLLLIGGKIANDAQKCSNVELCDTEATYYWENEYTSMNWGMRQRKLKNGQLYGKVYNDPDKGNTNYVYADRYENGQLKSGSSANSDKKYYLIALPSYYVLDGATTNEDIGSQFLVTTDTGSFYAVFADLHADGDTKKGNNAESENCVGKGSMSHYMLGFWGSSNSPQQYESYFGKIVSIQRLTDGNGKSDGNIGGCSGGSGLSSVNASWKPDFTGHREAWYPGGKNPQAGVSIGGLPNIPNKGQCVYWATGFLVQVYGLTPPALGNGNVFASNLCSTYPEKFVYVNGNTGTPVAGTIYSGSSGEFGHVGVILNYDEKTGSVVLFDGNWYGTGAYKIWTTNISFLRSNYGNLVFANPKGDASISTDKK